MKKSIVAFSLATVFVLSIQTQAAVTLQTPSGLAAGDTFRFIFLTQDTIAATSADISTYDTFVTSQAGGAQYQGATISWKPIISTSTIDARDHVGGFGTNVPVYGGDGTKIANSMTTDAAGGLWSSFFARPGAGILDSPARGVDGALFTGSIQAWTGSQVDGTRDAFSPVGSSSGLSTFGNASPPRWYELVECGQRAQHLKFASLRYFRTTDRNSRALQPRIAGARCLRSRRTTQTLIVRSNSHFTSRRIFGSAFFLRSDPSLTPMPDAKLNKTAPTWNAGSRANGDHPSAAGTSWHSHRQMGLKTLSDHFQELGADFGEEIERRASDAKLILETAAKYGVPPEMLWKAAAGLSNSHDDPR